LKSTQISNFLKIRQVGTELLHVDRQPNRHDNANGRFLQFCEVPKNQKSMKYMKDKTYPS